MEQIFSYRADEIEGFLAHSGFESARIEKFEPGQGARISRIDADGMVFDEAKYGCSFFFEFDSMLGALVSVIHSGTVAYECASGKETYCGGDVAFLAPGSGPYTMNVQRLELMGIILDPRLLHDTAPAGSRHTGRPVRFTSPRPHSPAAAQLVRAVLLFVRDGVLANPFARQSPLMTSSAAQALATAVLTAFPNDVADAEPTLTDTRDGSGATYRRAVRYIEDNAHRDLRLGDIARHARVTPRALHYAFARHGDCTLHRHLRRVRLERAHAELKAADPGKARSVKEIAARWGFSNSGRFATAYKDAYGVNPSTTLRYW
ncbi:AraC family transcriptional regulator [Streptomyces sp. NPDC057939]|uniref:helix-turn-helix transcriptional regulator n=1 Tax=Streptomyces sp. NPDC057939 TaxID=3346284 RepID=UPI0036E42127